MARTNFDDWIPEEHGGQVITKVAQMSAVERLAKPEPMSTDTKSIPRDGGMTFTGAIGRGTAYDETAATEDEVLLTARKFGKVVRIADEDLKDAAGAVDIIRAKQLDWARVEAIGIDNAALGVSAAENGTTIPFTSVYKAINTDNADVGYTADANLLQSGGAITYQDLSDVFAFVESGFWADGEMVVIAHPLFKSYLRGITGTLTYYDGTSGATASDGRPVFVEAAAGSGAPSTLFDVPITWSLGARVHATASAAPTGNALLIVANRNYLIKGMRSNPEYKVAGADSGAAFLTDEALLKMRIRRGFAVANENAIGVLEKS